jgi:hypothetical protein
MNSISIAAIILFSLVLLKFTEGNLMARQFSIDRSEGARSFQTVTFINHPLPQSPTKDILVFFHPWTTIPLKNL